MNSSVHRIKYLIIYFHYCPKKFSHKVNWPSSESFWGRLGLTNSSPKGFISKRRPTGLCIWTRWHVYCHCISLRTCRINILVWATWSERIRSFLDLWFQSLAIQFAKVQNQISKKSNSYNPLNIINLNHIQDLFFGQ